MVALLVFIIATVTLENAKGPFGDNVMTNPARYIYIKNRTSTSVISRGEKIPGL